MKIWISFLLVVCFVCADADADADADGRCFTSIGRNLLQAKKPCPVDFEYMNYTIITSRCKGPEYPPKSCCDAFKDFACPYSDALNDLSNDCSERMFSYINLYGNYTAGLFSLICHDDKIGLICPASPPGAEMNNVGDDSNDSLNIRSSLLLRLSMGFIIFLFIWI